MLALLKYPIPLSLINIDFLSAFVPAVRCIAGDKYVHIRPTGVLSAVTLGC